ncbi:DUF6708 domain-containing protein [Paraburkholderia phosphatilytica]|uniref:DUF6708 domain-containing protein n=1 Tax=Paraburkholderia phosphatilytica TaxID=2282883 RepID=UPI000E54A4D2|nr:DUF6708 domain-containing protein [Paraburkholderia phosphatilytica]
MNLTRITRAVTDDEVAARLQQNSSYSDSPRSSGTAFTATETYLEVCDGLYREKGWGLLAFAMGGIPALLGTVMGLWMATDIPQAIQQKGQAGLAHWVFGFLSLVCFGAVLWASRSLLVDCFNYTRKPVRFNRIDRTIYAFRRSGPNGVISVTWDKAFFYVERKPKAGLTSTAPRVVRCLVLDENGRVTDSFPIGKRVVLASSEDGRLGQEVMKELYADFEYCRRFMEYGPANLPDVEEFLPVEVTFRNSLKLEFDGMSDMLNSGNLFLWLVGVLAAIPTFVLGCANYVAQLTCREPVWPEEVERACSPAGADTERLAT